MQDNTEPKVRKFAHNNYGEIISINDAKSGFNGYYCIGCNAIMMAKKGEIKDHHFAHHANEKEKHLEKCLYGDETIIHKLAKDILQISKKIKVGSMYLDIPKEFGGGKSLLQKDRYIEAASVLIEASIYENEFGEVVVGKNIDDKKYLSIKPDITFLDSDNKPILLIEIYKTHKIDAEKEAKIRRLGIDTVEIRIPHISDKQELNDIFHISKHTHWIYNYEKATTIYNANTHQPIQRDSAIIDNETEFSYEETFDCRSFRIKEAIRGLRNFIQGSQFRETETNLRNEIDRVESNTKRLDEELRERNNRARAEADKRVDRTEERNLYEVRRKFRLQRGLLTITDTVAAKPNYKTKLADIFLNDMISFERGVLELFVNNNYIPLKDDKEIIEIIFNQSLEDNNKEVTKLFCLIKFYVRLKNRKQKINTSFLFAIASLKKDNIIGYDYNNMLQVAHQQIYAGSNNIEERNKKVEIFHIYLKALKYYTTKNTNGQEITWLEKLLSDDRTEKFKEKLEKYEREKPKNEISPQYVIDIFPELF